MAQTSGGGDGLRHAEWLGRVTRCREVQEWNRVLMSCLVLQDMVGEKTKLVLMGLLLLYTTTKIPSHIIRSHDWLKQNIQHLVGLFNCLTGQIGLPASYLDCRLLMVPDQILPWLQ